MLNVVALMGRLVADPELKTTQSGNSVCTFRIAVDRGYVPQGEERQADFITVTSWRKTAEFVCKYFQKGSLIAIEGSLQTRQYQDKSGNNRTATEVLASRVSFAGSKASNGASVQSSGQQTENYARNANASQNASQAVSGPNDFSVIDDGDDFPF